MHLRRLIMRLIQIGILLEKSKYQANQASNSVADTGIPSPGPGGSPFSHIFGLTKEEKREHAADASTAPAPSTRATYLPNLQML
eukprot:1157190-Pelagomonas_calceolata.AAC.1